MRRFVWLPIFLLWIRSIGFTQVVEYRVEWYSQQRVSLSPLEETFTTQVPSNRVSSQGSDLDITLRWQGKLVVSWIEVPAYMHSSFGVSEGRRAVLLHWKLLPTELVILSGNESAAESELERLKDLWRRASLYTLWTDGIIAGVWSFADDGIAAGTLTHLAYWLSPYPTDITVHEQEEPDMYGRVLVSIQVENVEGIRRVSKHPMRYVRATAGSEVVVSSNELAPLMQEYERGQWLPKRTKVQGKWLINQPDQFTAEATIRVSVEQTPSLRRVPELLWALLYLSQRKSIPLYEAPLQASASQAPRYSWRSFAEALEALQAAPDQSERNNRLAFLRECFTDRPLWCAEAQNWLINADLETPLAVDVLTALRDARSVAAQSALIKVAEAARTEESWEDYETVVMNLASVQLVSPVLLEWLLERVQSSQAQEWVPASLTIGTVAHTLYSQGSVAEAVRVIRKLRERLERTSVPAEQRILLSSLGNSRMPAVLEWILPYTYSDAPLTRCAALNALCGLDDTVAESRLLEAFEDDSEQVCLVAIRCFQYRPTSERVIRTLLAKWSTNWSTQFRREAIQVISRSANPQLALSALEEVARRETNDTVRLFALSAIEVLKENLK